MGLICSLYKYLSFLMDHWPHEGKKKKKKEMEQEYS